MKVERREHNVWKKWQSMPKEIVKKLHRKKPLIGKWQYVYSSKKGRISLIFLPDYFPGHSFWEIYCQEGELFDDVERFATKKQAMKRIKELLK